jgi:hypothetical protein
VRQIFNPEIEIIERMEAESFEQAIDLARKLRDELPEIDAATVTAWTIECKEPQDLSG